METLKQHWENIYEKRPLTDVSWYEAVPETLLSLIEEIHLSKNAAIIDIGGGDSFLAEDLLKKDIRIFPCWTFQAHHLKEPKHVWGRMLIKYTGLKAVCRILRLICNMIFGMIARLFIF